MNDMPHDHQPTSLAKWIGHSGQPALAALLIALCLTACGGGGGGGGSAGNSGSSSTPTDTVTTFYSQPPVAVPNNTFGVDCSGNNCGAIDGSTYSGSGVGIWRYTNTTSTPTSVPVGISGTFGKDVTLILTNLGAINVPLASVAAPPLTANMRAADEEPAAEPDNEPGVNRIPDQIRRFRPPALERGNTFSRSLVAPDAPSANTLGTSRNWYDHNEQAHTATLFEYRTASDGRRINFWVENGEYGAGKVTSEQLQDLADTFAVGNDAVYSLVTSLAGQPWGSHIYNNLIGPTQPIDVVLLNLTPDSAPWGLVGFFWGRNNFLSSSEPFSNESLSFYLDTETLYLSGMGLWFETSTLAHELVHMINFYQRAIVRSTQSSDYSFDSWLEEMSALMMEDVVGTRLDALYHVIRDDRFPKWLMAEDFNCDITQFDDSTSSPCFGYNLTGSFGAWLLRHYGLDFYTALLTNTSSTDSVAVLDDAIRDAGGLGFKDAVRRWGTLLALLPGNNAPDWFGLPERTQRGFTLPAIDGAAYVSDRQLPTTAPNPLLPNGHYPRVVTNVPDPYVETVTVPAYTTLTVIVQ